MQCRKAGAEREEGHFCLQSLLTWEPSDQNLLPSLPSFFFSYLLSFFLFPASHLRLLTSLPFSLVALECIALKGRGLEALCCP